MNGSKYIFISSSSRTFNFPLDKHSLDVLSKKNFSDETLKKVRWVRNIFAEWRFDRNMKQFEDEVVECDLEYRNTITPESLVFAMQRFVTEIRKLDGSDYPPKNLYQIVLCVQFHLETLGFTWKLLDQDMFKEIRFTLDNVMKIQTSCGVGVTVKKADIITKTDEDILWNKRVLGVDNPEQLLYTVLYVIGLNCALRAGKEHRNLRSVNSMFTCMMIMALNL